MPRQPESFGRYELVEPLAQGGMAEIWRARLKGAAGFERGLVLKRVLPELVTDRTYVDLFLREARLSARLGHPNLVTVFELGEHEGAYYLVMEHVDGVDLCDLVAARPAEPLPIGCVALIGRELCRGLHYVHELADEQGRPLRMVHRDVNPSNIMISREGAVKLVDFGVAKALASSDHSAVHELKGKLAYLAPEQILRRPADHRCDLFAVGITLHELLSGRRLFRCEGDRETLRAVLRAPIFSPSHYNAEVPRALDEIVMRALERNPSHRYASGEALAEALDEFVHQTRTGATQLAALVSERLGERKPAPPDDRPTEVSAAIELITLDALTHLDDNSSPGGTPTDVVLPLEPVRSRRRVAPILAALAATAGIVIAAVSMPVAPPPAPLGAREVEVPAPSSPVPNLDDPPSLPTVITSAPRATPRPPHAHPARRRVTLASAAFERARLVPSPSAPPPLLPPPGASALMDPYPDEGASETRLGVRGADAEPIWAPW